MTATLTWGRCSAIKRGARRPGLRPWARSTRRAARGIVSLVSGTAPTQLPRTPDAAGPADYGGVRQSRSNQHSRWGAGRCLSRRDQLPTRLVDGRRSRGGERQGSARSRNWRHCSVGNWPSRVARTALFVRAVNRCCPGASASPGLISGRSSDEALYFRQAGPVWLPLPPRSDPTSSSARGMSGRFATMARPNEGCRCIALICAIVLCRFV
jgi:hypothetical protein